MTQVRLNRHGEAQAEVAWRIRGGSGTNARSGNGSAIAAPNLIDLGYTNIDNLDGGMNAWTASGRQPVRLNRQSRPRASSGAAPRATPGLVEPPPASPPI